MPSGPGSRRVIGTLHASYGRSVLMVTRLFVELTMDPATFLYTYMTRRPRLAAISRSKLAVDSQISGDLRAGVSTRLLPRVMLRKSGLFTAGFASPGSWGGSPLRSCQLNTAFAVALRLNASA